MAITTMDGIVAGMANNPPRKSFLIPTLTGKGNAFQGIYPSAGFPGPSATQPPPVGTPGTVGLGGAIPLNADSRVRFTNPVSGSTYLARFSAIGQAVGTYTLFDRLWHNSGLSGTLTTAQNVNSIPLTRPDSTGADVELWLQIYTATGATGVTATASYTNQDGTSGRSAAASLATAPLAGQMIPFTLQSGDSGVRSVQTVILSATTGTAGNWGLVLLRRLANVSQAALYSATEKDVFQLGQPQVYDSACLDLMVLAGGTVLGPVVGDVELIQG